MEINKIIVNNITYIIKDNRYYKVVQNNLVIVNQEEQIMLDNLFKLKRSMIMRSSLVSFYLTGNTRIKTIDIKTLLNPILKKVEYIIPFDYRNAFYTNLKDFDIVVEGEGPNSYFQVMYDDKHNIINSTQGVYDIGSNIIALNKDCFLRYGISDKETLSKVVSSILFHEFLHMSSAEYIDNKRNYFKNGFSSSLDSIMFNGLTECYTELLTAIYYPNEILQYSGYNVDTLIALQLVQLVGKDTLDKAYFKDHSIEKIMSKLRKIIPDQELARCLLLDIECMFELEDRSIPSTYLKNIEKVIIKYFKAKIDKEINNGLNETIVNQEIEKFQCSLITKEKLIKLNKKLSLFLEMEEVENDFNNICHNFKLHY